MSLRFVRFRDDKSTANDEQVVKKIVHSIQDGVTKEQLLACMDRVRAAWKAREKGLPMPPLPSKAPGNLTLTTQITPTASVSNTPTSSSVLQSPGFPSASSGYFRESHDGSSRSNSISDEPPMPMKRKSSTPSVTTPLKESVEVKEDEPVERKRLKSLVEEEAPPPPSSASTSASTNSTSSAPLLVNIKAEKADVVKPPFSNNNEHQHLSRQAQQQPIALPPSKQRVSKQVKSEESRSRKSSLVEEKAAPDLQLPPSSSAKVSKIPAAVNTHSVRTLSAPAIAAMPEAAQTASPELTKAEYEDSRRSKSIPQLPKETIMQTPKKAKSSSSIHNLLTTSVEPTPSKRAYDFSNILQKNKRSSPVQQQQQQQLQQQAHHPQFQQQQQPQAQQPHQPQPVQFINFHAEGRQSPQQMNKSHVLIIRSESNSQPAITAQHQQQQQQRTWKNSSSNNSVNNNVKYEKHTPTPPPRSQSPSSHIAPSQESYSPYNNHAVPTPYHHLPPQNQPPPPPPPQQQPFHPSYFGQYQHQPPQAPIPPPQQQHPAHMFGYRRNEQPVAHAYQQQAMHRQQPYPQPPHPPPPQQNTIQPSSSSPMSPPKRKNSQKAKLDFILN